MNAASPFTRTYALPGGPRVRLRLARRADRLPVHILLIGRGVDASDLDVERLLSYDPARRLVLCAFAPYGGEERLVGIGAIDLAHDAEVDTLVVDERLTDGLGPLLAEVLEARARAHRSRVA